MMIQRFLSRLPGALALFASSSLAFALTACGGNVIVDNSSGGNGAGGGSGGVATGGTTSPTTTGITTDPTGTTAVLECPAGYTACNNSYCADLANDVENCGACGAICEGAYCMGGDCYYPPDCVGCGQFITDGQGPLCPGTSQDLYDSLVNCVCAGVCTFQCSDNICTGQTATDSCITCVQDTVNGCGNVFNECANDF